MSAMNAPAPCYPLYYGQPFCTVSELMALSSTMGMNQRETDPGSSGETLVLKHIEERLDFMPRWHAGQSVRRRRSVEGVSWPESRALITLNNL
jgi:hypothetical protein